MFSLYFVQPVVLLIFSPECEGRAADSLSQHGPALHLTGCGRGVTADVFSYARRVTWDWMSRPFCFIRLTLCMFSLERSEFLLCLLYLSIVSWGLLPPSWSASTCTDISDGKDGSDLNLRTRWKKDISSLKHTVTGEWKPLCFTQGHILNYYPARLQKWS